MRKTSINFNDEMYNAILTGRKTQTRRVVKTPKKHIDFYLNGGGQWKNSKTGTFHEIAYDAFVNEEGLGYFLVAGDQGWDGGIECPYGKIGDELIIRDEITLPIVNLKIEHVQNINAEDAIAEGIDSQVGFAQTIFYKDYLTKVPDGHFLGFDNSIESFKSLWQSIYSEKYNWDRQLWWVWVITFEQYTK